MSRAFVKEPDSVGLDAPPEFQAADGPHPVTPAGIARMGETIALLEAQLRGEEDEAARNRIARDLRYWQLQQASATPTPAAQGDSVGFGSRVTLSRNGRTQTIEIVGEAEADPAAGRINWQAPLAAAVMGAIPGDVVTMDERDPADEITILAVQNR